MLSRVATFQHSNLLVQQSMSLQVKLAAAQSAQASGLQSESFSGLSRDVSALLSFNSQTTRLTTDSENAANFAQIIDQAYTSLGNILDLASTIRSQIAAKQSATDSSASGLAESAAQWRIDIAAMLNTSFGGQYLFAGAASGAAPVDLSLMDTSLADAATADTSYYKGADTSLKFTAASGYSTPLSVHANDSGFEKLLRAAALLENAPDDSATIGAAYDLVTEAIEELSISQETISARANALDRFQTQAAAQITALQGFSSDLKDADLADATVQVTQYQTQLEAAYSSLSVLLKTNLLDYL